MKVGGPNTRTDFHVNVTEEWFYQVRGKMVLKVVDGGYFRDILIDEGETFLLPPFVPHSPQRGQDTVGMVIEMDRPRGAKDGLVWYCQSCYGVVFEDWFVCEDLGTQLKERIIKYYEDEGMRTCKNCKAVDFPPTKLTQPLVIETGTNKIKDFRDGLPAVDTKTNPYARKLQAYVDECKENLKADEKMTKQMLWPDVVHKLFKIHVHFEDERTTSEFTSNPNEEWYLQLKGANTSALVSLSFYFWKYMLCCLGAQTTLWTICSFLCLLLCVLS